MEIGSGFKVENLRDKGVQEDLIREYLVDYQPTEQMLERVFELNRKYNSKIEETEEVARNVNWNLNKFEWDNLFNYGEGNSVSTLTTSMALLEFLVRTTQASPALLTASCIPCLILRQRTSARIITLSIKTRRIVWGAWNCK